MWMGCSEGERVIKGGEGLEEGVGVLFLLADMFMGVRQSSPKIMQSERERHGLARRQSDKEGEREKQRKREKKVKKPITLYLF